MKKSIYYLGFWSLLLTIAFACSSDDDAAPATPVASFQSEADATNFLQITFTNFSTNFVTSAWSFGDGNISADENPVHTYAEAGTYDVTLTVVNASGTESTITKQVEVSDPAAKLTLLAGLDSKTWKLFREGISLQWGAEPETNGIWSGLQNDGKRPCLYEQEFTFTRDGQFIFDDKGVFWAEYTPWLGTAIHETCFDVTAANMVNGDGDDVSAWGSGTHTYTYDVDAGQVTLNGLGAWMGFVNVLGNDVYSSVPTETRVLNITIEEFVGYDVMTILYTNSADVWTCKYASYSDATLEPTLVTEYVEPPCDPLAAISPTEISHTFASNDAAEWVLLQPSASGSVLTLGVDDPTDAAAAKVGQYTRVAGTQYQELQFKLDPANAINFENVTTMSMEVYMPSSNDYSGGLTDNVFIGFGATTCPPEWYTDQHEYQELAIAKDTWVTITFNLATDADYVAVPDNGATVFDRNDLDMIYISIGGNDHFDGGEFYMRNFIIQ